MSKQLTCAETAKLVREALKEAYPTIKFNVTSKNYTGGSSIGISYTDGVTTDEINAIVEIFRGADFDGMEDIETYRDDFTYKGETYSSGANYIKVDRKYSKETYEWALNLITTQNPIHPMVYGNNFEVIEQPYGAEVQADYEYAQSLSPIIINTDGKEYIITESSINTFWIHNVLYKFLNQVNFIPTKVLIHT